MNRESKLCARESEMDPNFLSGNGGGGKGLLRAKGSFDEVCEEMCLTFPIYLKKKKKKKIGFFFFTEKLFPG